MSIRGLRESAEKLSRWFYTHPRRYGFAVGAVLAATTLRYALGLYAGLKAPFTLFYPAVMLVTLVAGLGPGIFATVACAVLAGSFFLTPSSSSLNEHPKDIVGLALFVCVGMAISGLAEISRRRAGRLEEFERAIEGLSEMIGVVDRDQRYVIANRSFLQYHDLTQQQVIGQRAEDILNPEAFRAHVKEKLDEAFRGNAVQFEMKCSYPVLGKRNLLISYLPIDGARGVDRVVCILQDVTQRKQAEEALRSSEQEYRVLFEKNLAGVVISTLNGDVLECNDAWARMLGYDTAEEVHGRRTIEFYYRPADRDPLVRELEQKGGFFSREMALKRKDGSLMWVVLNCVVLSRGGRTVVQATVIDISKSKQAEDALREREEHFRILVEQAPDGIFIADAEGKYFDVNSAGVEMLGYTREEILERNISDLVAAEEVERVPVEVGALTGGQIVRSEWKFRRKDGSFFAGEVYARKLPDGRLQAVLRDISERKRIEELVRQSEERFRVALKDSPITVFNQDRELRYTWIYNPQFCWQQEILGKNDDEILGIDKARRLRGLKQNVLETGASVREEVTISYNGKSSSFDMSVEPLLDAQRNIVGITGASIDIARLRELADSLQKAKETLIREKSYLQQEIQAELGFEGIIGQSSTLREVLAKARVVAATDSTVLLLGETGTGKELVARSIHALSSRHDKNFIKLNCAAVPTGLLESELFGHEKGAFTGAVNQKVGRLELADKGTLFLDEIGELPPELQPKLLRALQDREFERLGGVRTVRVDVRIISATNRDLRKDVAEKKFREDLFYRLNVFPIELPPLRERRADIPMLVHHFVQKYAARMGKHIEVVPVETMEVLEEWNWPGNIRELENMIERMVILTKTPVLAAPPSELEYPAEPTEDNLTEMEREHIVRVLRETNGVLSGVDGAASRLGVKRTTLQSMLKRLNIQLQDYRRGTGTYGG